MNRPGIGGSIRKRPGRAAPFSNSQPSYGKRTRSPLPSKLCLRDIQGQENQQNCFVSRKSLPLYIASSLLGSASDILCRASIIANYSSFVQCGSSKLVRKWAQSSKGEMKQKRLKNGSIKRH